MKKSSFSASFVALAVLLFMLPGVSFADTQITFTTTAPTHEALISTLKSQIVMYQKQLLALLQAQLAAATGTVPPYTIGNVTAYPAAVLSIPTGQSTDITSVVQTDKSVGTVRIAFTGFRQLQQPNSLAPTSPLNQPLAEFLLSYSANPMLFSANPPYTTIPAELWVGQSTNYMNETLMLSSIASTSVQIIAAPTHN